MSRCLRNNVSLSSKSRWEFSIVALVGAVMLLMISLALVNPQHGRSDSAGNFSLFSSSEFSSGVPIL
jgi:hypothetical protein